MFKFHFWQIASARFTALLIGIAVGAHWHEFFSSHLLVLLAIGIIGSFYILYTVLKQSKR